MRVVQVGAGALRIAAAVLATMGFGAAHAVQVTYDFVGVGYAQGGGDNASLTGGEALTPFSSNLPVAFTGGSTAYQFGAAAGAGNVSVGTWSWTNGTDSLYGTQRTLTEQFNIGGTPFARYTGVRTIDGGTGYFAGATGSGTNEFFAYYLGAPAGTFFYNGVDIARMSVTVETDNPLVQTDTRPVVVLAKNGIQNLQTGVGSEAGIFTSRSPGLSVLETETSEYTFLPLPIAGPPFVGTFEDVGPTGTIHGKSVGDNVTYGHLGTIFDYAHGDSQTTGGTGEFAGATGSSVYQVFSVTTNPQVDAQTYSSVIVARINPVPEPSTYALLIAGLAGIAFVIRRRPGR